MARKPPRHVSPQSINQLRRTFQPLAIVDAHGTVLDRDTSQASSVFRLQAGEAWGFQVHDCPAEPTHLLEIRHYGGSEAYVVMAVPFRGEPLFVLLKETEPADLRTLLETQGDLYALVVAQSPNAFFALDSAGHYVAANHAAVRLTGWPLPQLLRMHYADCVVADDRPRVSAAFRQLMLGHPVVLSCNVQPATGRERRVSIDAFPVSVGGAVVGAFCIARDSTESARQEQMLRVQREALASITRGVSRDAAIQQLIDGLQSLFPRSGVAMLTLKDQALSYRYGAGNLPLADLATVKHLPIQEETGLAACVTRGTFVAVPDVRADPLLTPCSDSLHARGFRQAWAVPVHSEAGTAYGALLLLSPDDAPPPMEDMLRSFAGLIGVVWDRSQADERLYREAHHDALTQLPNRRLLQETLDEWIRAAPPAEWFSVYLVDIDRFRNANSTYGPIFGDYLLARVADLLRGLADADTVVGRLSADEFLILRRGDPRDASEEAFGHRVLRLFAKPLTIESRAVRVTVSIGAARFPDHGITADALLSHVGAAAWDAKQTGGDALCLYTPGDRGGFRDRLRLEVELQHALERREFVPYFQPLWDARTGRLMGAEALARWVHPDQGLVSPARFIPLAEETGLIIPLTRQLMEQVAEVLAALHEPAFRCALNISPLYLQRRDVLEDLRQVSAPHGLALTQWTVEVVESSFGQPEAEVVRTMAACRAAGILVALDDFGTAYSSLSRLEQLPLDYVKVDQTFVHAMASKSRGYAIVRAIIDLAHGLGLQTVAEGVETPEQQRALTQMGCDCLQGFLLGRPQPAAEFMALFRRQ